MSLPATNNGTRTNNISNSNAPPPNDLERQAQEDKKNAITLSYNQLLSVLGAFLTLKAIHAISTLTGGKRPSRRTRLDAETRILVHFLNIVPESLYRPHSSTGLRCDGAGESPQAPLADLANVPTKEASSTYFNSPLLRASSSILPAVHMSQYASQASGEGVPPGCSNGNGNGNGNGNPNPAPHDSPALSFTAFVLPSNTDRDDNSFLQSLSGCAPYRRVARESALTEGARRQEDINEMLQHGIERQNICVESNNTGEISPGDEQHSDELHITNAYPAQHYPGPEVNMYDLERTRSSARSFPGENPMSCGLGEECLGRRKPVTSVRPFTDFD